MILIMFCWQGGGQDLLNRSITHGGVFQSLATSSSLSDKTDSEYAFLIHLFMGMLSRIILSFLLQSIIKKTNEPKQNSHSDFCSTLVLVIFLLSLLLKRAK